MKPDCYTCKHRQSLPGDCHSACANGAARVKGKEHGIKHGWFFWPFNFDPIWLESCNGYEPLNTERVESYETI